MDEEICIIFEHVPKKDVKILELASRTSTIKVLSKELRVNSFSSDQEGRTSLRLVKMCVENIYKK